MAVYYVQKEESQEKIYSVYTDKSYFEVEEFGGVSEEPHVLGLLPITEYPADSTAHLGIFEVVLPLLDALDELQSNRMDDIVQYVNSFLAIMGAQLDEETYKKLNEYKTLCLPEGTDAKYLSPSMSQGDVQTLKDDLYQTILTITGVPNRNGGTSTSDTGLAVVYRDGHATANMRAASVETAFKRAEKHFLKLILRILRDTVGTSLKLTDIQTHFTRRNYENVAAKSQVLVAMLNNPKIHPELAFQYCGLFTDPESAYLQSKAYYEEQMEKWEPVEVNEDVRVS
jgi:SPP1 family phage portal protein